MKKKFILQVVAWLLTVAMLLPSAGAALTTAYAAEGKVAYKGSATFAASGEWAEKELSLTDLIGTVDPDDVAYINFSSDVKVNVGYNKADHSGWQWAGFASSRDVTDIALDDWFACKLALNQNDGKQYTVTWSVYTGDAKTPEQEKEESLVSGPAHVVHSDSVTFSDSTYWTAKELIGSASLIGDVNPDEVAYVKFTSDTDFFIGYNSTSNNNSYWQISDPVNTWIADDINWAADAYYLQLMLSKGNGVPYTIKWEVVSKVAATPTPTPKPTATPTPTPVPKYTEVGETLTVTEDMVKDGVVTIKNAQYDEIIVPAGLGITKVDFNVVDVEKLVLTGGENYAVNLRNALVGTTDIAAPQVDEMTFDELKEALEAAREAEDATAAITAVIEQFQASMDAKNAAAAAVVKVTARDSEIDAITVKANADINVAEASVKELAVSTKDAVSRMEVKVTGFDGDASVDLDKGGRAYNAPLALRFKNSEVETLNVSGKEILHIEGSKSTVETMTVSDVVSVSTNLDADTLVVDEATKNADVRIYADVQNLAVDGEKNDIILPSCAEIEYAFVAGDDICVYGLGSLNNAEVTGTGANVATIGTAVEGENDSTMPQAMIDMLPTAAPVPPTPIATPIPLEGAAYAGSGMFYDGGNNYWNQYVVSQSDILGSVAPEDVDHITFTSEVNLVIGYNPIGDSNWTNTDSDGAKKVTVMGSDIEMFDSINVILRNETKKDQEVVWRVYTTPMTEEEEKEEVTNSITFSDSTGWSAVTPSMSDILGNIKPADVESIEFSSTTEFAIGYKNKTGTTTVGDDPYFTKVEGKSSYVISADDIVLEKFDAPDGETKWFYMQIILQKNDGVEYTISWKINLKESAGSGGDNEADADYVGDWGTGYKFDADAFADLTGEVTVALKYRTVSTASDYQIKAYERTNPWKDLVPADYAKTDYAVNSKYNTMTLDKTEGTVSFTLTADVVERIKTNAVGIGIQVYNVIIEEATVTGTEVEEPKKPEVVVKDGAGSITFADSNGWTQQELSATDLLAGVAAEEVESITFTSDTAFTIGYNNNSGDGTVAEDNPYWSQPTGKTSYTLSNIVLDKYTDENGGVHEYYLVFALSDGDGVKYTINWTVNKKATTEGGEGNEGGTGDTPVVIPGGGSTGTGSGSAIVTPPADKEEDTHTHSYESKVTTEATCEAEGVTTYTCSCGDSYTEPIEATGHSYVDGVCEDCGAIEPVVTELFMDSGYAGKYGASKNIPATVFAQYTDDITVTVTYELTGDDANPWFKFLNSSWGSIPTSAEANSEGMIYVDASANSFTFTIAQTDIPTTNAFFQICGLYVTSVTLSGVGTVDADAAFVGGTYAIGHKIHDAQLEEFRDKDIKVTFTYRKAEDCSDYNAALCAKYTDCTGYYSANPEEGTISRALTAEQVNSILDSTDTEMFLGIKVNGLIIESVTITEDDYVVYLYDNGAAEAGFWTDQVTWLTEAEDTDVITFVYSGDEGKDYWGFGEWQAKVDGANVSGPKFSFGADSTQETTTTYTAGELKTAFGITETSTVENIQVVVYNTAKIILLKIEPAAN